MRLGERGEKREMREREKGGEGVVGGGGGIWERDRGVFRDCFVVV